MVSLSTATVGAVIHYTTNGSTPTSSSLSYTSPISVAGHGTSMVIKAIAIKSQMLDSAIASGTYTICYDQVATPTFSPGAGTYASDQSVTISTTTTGATIYYTTDGTTPTTSSTLYSSPVSVAGEGTGIVLRAIAVKSQMLDSSIASGIFTISGYGLVGRWLLNSANGLTDLSSSGNNGTSSGGVTIGGETDRFGQVGGATTFDGSDDSVTIPNNNMLDFGVGTNFTMTAWIKRTDTSTHSGVILYAGGGNSGRYWFGVVDDSNINGDLEVNTYYGSNGDYWRGVTSNFNDTNWHHLAWSVNKTSGTQSTYYDGALIATTAAFNGNNDVGSLIVGNGSGISRGYFKGSIFDIRAYNRALSSTEIANIYNHTLNNQVLPPAFSPTPGKYTFNQPVTLSSGTSGAVIHYTTNGTTPTSSSPIYSTPIPVAGETTGATTIKAIAVKAGMLDSDVISGIYTNGLVGRWMLDTTHGVTDLSPYGNNGTANGGISVGGAIDRLGQTGGATTFDGTDDHINTGSGTSLNVSSDTSISLWFKVDGANQTGILYYRGSLGSNGYALAIHNGNGNAGKKLTLWTGGINWNLLSTYTPPSNQWLHAVVTRSANTWTLYINGVVQTTGTGAPNAPSSVGGISMNGGWYFKGSMSDVRAYNRALTPAEITTLYNSN